MSACVEYRGARNADGYGVLPVPVDGSRLAHRAALAEKLGRPVQGVARHSCDNPPCINQDHLLEGTQADNIADAVARGRNHGGRWNQSHCKRGHEMTPENTRMKPNRQCKSGYERRCIACERVRSTANNDRRRGVAKRRATHGQ